MPHKPKIVWTRCGWCGKLLQAERRKLKRYGGRFCDRAHASWWAHYIRGIDYPDMSGHKNPSWKGGITIHSKGYIYEYAPDHPAQSNGYVLQHRLVAERKLGRYLCPEEVAHHKDGNKQNNRPDNIEVFKGQRDHTLHHHKIRRASR